MIHFRGNFLERLGTPYESGVPCSGCPNDCESVAVGGGAQYDYIATNQISGRFIIILFLGVFYSGMNHSTVGYWRKVILVIFMIFELGPDSESL